MQKTKDLFNQLAWKCYQNKLNFEYNCTLNKVLIGSPDYKLIADGDMDQLNELHDEIDGYLEIEQMQDEEFITNRPCGVSSDEVKMKEAGHKQSDFM